MQARRLLAASFLMSLAAAPLGCGRDADVAAPRPTAEQGAADLESARREVEALRGRVAERQQASESAEAQQKAAEAALQAAAEAYEQARDALSDAEQKLASLAPPAPSDDEVFRRVQRQLLEAPALADVAIKAEVDERRVTLYGSVPDDATRDAAVSIASGVDGVASVESEIRVGSE